MEVWASSSSCTRCSKDSRRSEKLVPNGRGELVMIKGTAGNTANSQDGTTTSNESSDNDAQHQMEQFIGVSPRVSFTGKKGENQLLMKQLSGGQRALVALTLIFAIQRCDPAPFYLFDEIDSALDASYRTTVAAMIQRQSKDAQFITTTFRPELVRTSDKCFGVQFQNKISSIVPIEKNEAFKFVETVDAGERTTTTSKRASSSTVAPASKRVRAQPSE